MINREKLSNTIALPKIREDGGVPKKVAEIKSKYDPEKYNIIYHTTKDPNEAGEEEKKPKTSNSDTAKKVTPAQSNDRLISSSQSNVKLRITSSRDKQKNNEKELQNTGLNGKKGSFKEFGGNNSNNNDTLNYTQTGMNNMEIIEEGRISEYKNEEDDLVCYR